MRDQGQDSSFDVRPRLIHLKAAALFAGAVLALAIAPTSLAHDPPAEQVASLFPLESWKQQYSQVATTPEGAIKVWFDAIFLFIDPETRDLGRDVLGHLTIPLMDDDQWQNRPSNSTFVSRLEDEAHHHIFRSYAVGATPENGYAMDPQDYELRIESSREDAYGRGWRLSLESGGADNPRPVYLRKSSKSGLYFVDGFGNVYLGIRPPIDPDAERFE